MPSTTRAPISRSRATTSFDLPDESNQPTIEGATLTVFDTGGGTTDTGQPAGCTEAGSRTFNGHCYFPTTSPLFVGLLIGVIVIVAALTYFPAVSLGPLVEGLS